MNRRLFLISSGLILTSCLSFSNRKEKKQYLLASAQDQKGQNFLIILSPKQEILFQEPIPHRGHDSCVIGNNAIFFSRGPETKFYIVDLINMKLKKVIHTPKGRHLYGHGCGNPSGSKLYVTENDYVNGIGIIAIYDIKNNFRRSGEIPSFGIGPHQIIYHQAMNCLAVANGGLKTHPLTPKLILNKENINSNLSLISESGKLLDAVTTPFPQLSIRHLSIAPDGSVIFACQDQEWTPFNKFPLVWSYTIDKKLESFDFPIEMQKKLKGYIGSVACHNDLIIATSPRGDGLLKYSYKNKKLIEFQQIDDCSGVANGPSGVWITSGKGNFFRLSQKGNFKKLSFKFDNHLTSG